MSSETERMVQGESSLHCTSVILLMWPMWSKNSYSSEPWAASRSQIFTDSADESINLASKGQNLTDRIGSVWPSSVRTTGLLEASSEG